MIEHNKTYLSQDDIDKILYQLRSGIINDSSARKVFEEMFKKYTNGNNAYAQSTGTLAIIKALRSIGVSERDVIITTTYTCIDVYNAIKYTGANVLLVDIDEDDFNMDTNDALNKIDSSVKAIIVPHMFGVPADIDKLRDTSTYVIEDCAWSLGSKLGGKHVGTIGDFGAFSFHALKGIVTGEGGMLLSQKPIEEYDGFIKNPGGLSVPYHLSNILAALGISQLSRVESILKKRQEITAKYDQLFNGHNLKTPFFKRGDGALLRYCIQLPEGVSIEKIKQFMFDRGIIIQRPVKSLLHSNGESILYNKAEKIFKKTISLPAHLHLTDNDQAKVASEIIKFLKNYA